MVICLSLLILNYLLYRGCKFYKDSLNARMGKELPRTNPKCEVKFIDVMFMISNLCMSQVIKQITSHNVKQSDTPSDDAI